MSWEIKHDSFLCHLYSRMFASKCGIFVWTFVKDWFHSLPRNDSTDVSGCDSTGLPRSDSTGLPARKLFHISARVIPHACQWVIPQVFQGQEIIPQAFHGTIPSETEVSTQIVNYCSVFYSTLISLPWLVYSFDVTAIVCILIITTRLACFLSRLCSQ